jgi:hypothetical protein
MFPAHIPGRGEPVYQLHRAVMLNLQAFRNLSNIRTHPRRHPLNGQKHLMLSRFQTQHASSNLARMQVSAYLMANLSQALIFTQGE